MQRVWIVSAHASDGWQVMGCYSSERLALEDAESRAFPVFIGPLTINQRLRDETIDWPGAYWVNIEESG